MPDSVSGVRVEGQQWTLYRVAVGKRVGQWQVAPTGRELDTFFPVADQVEVVPASSLSLLTDALEGIAAMDWYRRCLEDVQDGREVRGLAEAKAGYDAAFDAISAHLAGTQNSVGERGDEEPRVRVKDVYAYLEDQCGTARAKDFKRKFGGDGE